MGIKAVSCKSPRCDDSVFRVKVGCLVVHPSPLVNMWFWTGSLPCALSHDSPPPYRDWWPECAGVAFFPLPGLARTDFKKSTPQSPISLGSHLIKQVLKYEKFLLRADLVKNGILWHLSEWLLFVSPCWKHKNFLHCSLSPNICPHRASGNYPP